MRQSGEAGASIDLILSRIPDEFSIVAASIPTDPRALITNAVAHLGTGVHQHPDRQHRMSADEDECVPTLRARFESPSEGFKRGCMGAKTRIAKLDRHSLPRLSGIRQTDSAEGGRVLGGSHYHWGSELVVWQQPALFNS